MSLAPTRQEDERCCPHFTATEVDRGLGVTWLAGGGAERRTPVPTSAGLPGVLVPGLPLTAICFWRPSCPPWASVASREVRALDSSRFLGKGYPRATLGTSEKPTWVSPCEWNMCFVKVPWVTVSGRVLRTPNPEHPLVLPTPQIPPHAAAGAEKA